MIKNKDNLYDDAINVIFSEGKVSTSLIQRKLRIGYNRAAQLIEQLEQDKIISSPDNIGYRKILVNNCINRSLDKSSTETMEENKIDSDKPKMTLFEKIIWGLFCVIFIPIGISIFVNDLKTSSQKNDKEAEYVTVCENMIKSSLKRPATYKRGMFSRDVKIAKENAQITIKFEAKNGLGLSVEQVGVCIFNQNRIVDFNIYD